MTFDRMQELRRHIVPGSRGIEIGPYHQPIAPKRDGYRTVSIDLFDQEQLRSRAAQDPHISAEDLDNIEQVDLVGSANDLGELVMASYGDELFDYVLSSHNIEHLPNPIKFLQGCARVLAPGAVMSLAIPDHRYCFDFFRSRTEVVGWLEAFAEDRSEPSPGQFFQWVASNAHINEASTWDASARDFPTPRPLLHSAWQFWDGSETLEYVDAHCWAFTPSSFRLIIEDLRELGLHPFDVESVSQTIGCEFFVHLRHAPDRPPFSDMGEGESYADRRSRTMRAMILEEAERGRQFGSKPPPPPEAEVRVSPPAAPVRARWPRLRKIARKMVCR